MIPLQRRLGHSRRRPSWARSKTAPPEGAPFACPVGVLESGHERHRSRAEARAEALVSDHFRQDQGESPACC